MATIKYKDENGQWQEIAIGGSTVEVVDNLESESTTAALSANQGRVLNEGKQDALVSGTNIKTINNQSILGSGNITIEGGGGGGIDESVLDAYTPLVRDFSDDFNNDFTR